MITVGGSGRFVAKDDLPSLPLWVSGSIAYAAMVEAQVGALIALDGETPRYFVTARFVKCGLDFAARELGGAAASIRPLSSHLAHFWNPNSEFHASVEEHFKQTGLNVDDAVREISPIKLSRHVEAPSESRAVHQVFGTGEGMKGHSVGWYFARQATLDTIQTAPDQWLCKNDPPHKNANFDHGKCADCDADLIV